MTAAALLLATPMCRSCFIQLVPRQLTLEDNYLILPAHDVYDVPYRSKDGEKQEFVDAVFHSDIPMPAVAQKALFQAIFSEILDNNSAHN